MPDNVKTALSLSLQKLLRPLVRIMLREGLTYSQFATIARMAFVECAAKDFDAGDSRTSRTSLSALTGIPVSDIESAVADKEEFESRPFAEISNPFAQVLGGWFNDREYVGPYGFPIDLPFEGRPQSFSLLTKRYAPGIAPEVVVQELKRLGCVIEVGNDFWKPLKQEYIEPSLTPENLTRMASLVESLIATLESNTRKKRDGSNLFERTVFVGKPLTPRQLSELQSYLRRVGGQFLQRVDAYAAVDLLEKMEVKPGEAADIRAGLQCFLYVEASPDDRKLRDLIDFDH